MGKVIVKAYIFFVLFSLFALLIFPCPYFFFLLADLFVFASASFRLFSLSVCLCVSLFLFIFFTVAQSVCHCLFTQLSLSQFVFVFFCPSFRLSGPSYRFFSPSSLCMSVCHNLYKVIRLRSLRLPPSNTVNLLRLNQLGSYS